MKKPTSTALRFQISALSIFGDRENGRQSTRGIFTLHGELFQSLEPVSRQHATEINHEMTALREELNASRRTTARRKA